MRLPKNRAIRISILIGSLSAIYVVSFITTYAYNEGTLTGITGQFFSWVLLIYHYIPMKVFLLNFPNVFYLVAFEILIFTMLFELSVLIGTRKEYSATSSSHKTESV